MRKVELSSSATATALLLQPLLSPLIRRGTFCRLGYVSLKVSLYSSATVRPLLLLLLLCAQGQRLQSMVMICSPALHHRTPPPATLCDHGAAHPALQYSASMLTTQAYPPRCLLQCLLLVSNPVPTFSPRRTYRDVGGICDDRGSPV